MYLKLATLKLYYLLFSYAKHWETWRNVNPRWCLIMCHNFKKKVIYEVWSIKKKCQKWSVSVVQEKEIFTSLSAARTLLEKTKHRPLLLVEDSALEDFAGTCLKIGGIKLNSKTPHEVDSAARRSNMFWYTLQVSTHPNRMLSSSGLLLITSTIKRWTKLSGDYMDLSGWEDTSLWIAQARLVFYFTDSHHV